MSCTIYIRVYNAYVQKETHGGFLMKEKAKRALALIVCLIMLLAVMITPISAAKTSSKKGSSTSSSLTSANDVLNTITYAEYKAKLDEEGISKGTETIVISAQDYLKGGISTGLTVEVIKESVQEIFDDVVAFIHHIQIRG